MSENTTGDVPEIDHNATPDEPIDSTGPEALTTEERGVFVGLEADYQNRCPDSNQFYMLYNTTAEGVTASGQYQYFVGSSSQLFTRTWRATIGANSRKKLYCKEQKVGLNLIRYVSVTVQSW